MTNNWFITLYILLRKQAAVPLKSVHIVLLLNLQQGVLVSCVVLSATLPVAVIWMYSKEMMTRGTLAFQTRASQSALCCVNVSLN